MKSKAKRTNDEESKGSLSTELLRLHVTNGARFSPTPGSRLRVWRHYCVIPGTHAKFRANLRLIYTSTCASRILKPNDGVGKQYSACTHPHLMY